jgi:dienelactone hydrolase
VTTGISRLCEMPDGWILPKEMMRTTVALSVLLCRSLPTSSFMTTVFTENWKASLIPCKAIMEWSDLARAALDVVPEALVTSTPRVAKDSDYAGAVQKVWKQEQSTKQVSEFCRHRYKTKDGYHFYGTLIRRKREEGAFANVPGFLFFHTGAGPNDVCLQWKADSIVTNEDTFPDGCVVLIADILGDDMGWAWSSDRTRYNTAREFVLASDGSGARMQLQSAIMAAVNALKNVPGVDESRLAALGWCLGGHPVLELGRMKIPEMRAMVTFHGVFDGTAPPKGENEVGGCKVLICNGVDDPFVSKEALDNSIATFSRHGHAVEVLRLQGARHGFTNPAQDFNPNEAFAYNDDAAKTAWTAALSLLKSELWCSD